MARLETGGSSSGGGFRIPWKLVAAVAVIGVTWFLIYRQYRTYYPARRPQMARMRPGPPPDLPRGVPREFANLGLTDDQKSQLAKVASETTNPGQMRREAAKVLTDAQREQLKTQREQAAARRAEREGRQGRRAAAAGSNPQAIAERDRQTQAATQARREAARAQTTGTRAGP